MADPPCGHCSETAGRGSALRLGRTPFGTWNRREWAVNRVRSRLAAEWTRRKAVVERLSVVEASRVTALEEVVTADSSANQSVIAERIVAVVAVGLVEIETGAPDQVVVGVAVTLAPPARTRVALLAPEATGERVARFETLVPSGRQRP
ncbi:hypothetical protein ACFOZ7_09250 [Natribaculum luteum]|uniref:Uncharacterized protein n=1 Tax=Natribaculum luteum TaxID=1586232 RepID=A0ABD5NZ03_9EURY|nr:hypothetical protein [Natribaculum luteum]